MAVEIALPTIATILITALVDSINPCAIGVLILLISTLIVTKKRENIFKIGFFYISAVFLTYLLFGLGLISFVASVPLAAAEYISIAVGLVVIFVGIFEIKDYFWYGIGFSLAIPKKYADKIKEKVQNISIATVIFLGFFVAAVELPCTGGPYLAVTLLLAQNFNLTAFILLIIYNIIFVMPLIVILLLVKFGVKVQNIQEWKQANKRYMRLITGIVLIGLGWLLMLIANGTINLN